MANQFNCKPFLVDTVMVQSWRNQPSFLGLPPLYPRLVYWFNPAVAGDAFTIVNPMLGNMMLLQGRCENANQSQIFPMSGVAWPDFTVTTLGSGTLEIWY